MNVHSNSGPLRTCLDLIYFLGKLPQDSHSLSLFDSKTPVTINESFDTRISPVAIVEAFA